MFSLNLLGVILFLSGIGCSININKVHCGHSLEKNEELMLTECYYKNPEIPNFKLGYFWVM